VYDQIAFIRKTTQNKVLACSATATKQWPDGLEWINIRPNPLTDTESYLDVYLSKTGPFLFQIINMDGQILMEEKPLIQTGINSFSLKNMANLPKGNYAVKLLFGQKVITKTIVVQ
jgi:hypothetical protein